MSLLGEELTLKWIGYWVKILATSINFIHFFAFKRERVYNLHAKY